jgi:hypothetical protein
MSVKSKVLATAMALALLGGVSVAGAASAPPAGAASSQCGRGCLELLSRAFGSRAAPTVLLDVYKRGNWLEQPIILFRSSTADPAEDFTFSAEGTVADFYAAGLVLPSFYAHYANLKAYEIQYSPYGVDSSFCVGVPLTAATNTRVTLQPCGQSGKTVWVADSAQPLTSSYVPLINGSDTDFTDPLVLTYPAGANPAAVPRPVLVTRPLTTNPDGTVAGNQLWSVALGVLPPG